MNNNSDNLDNRFLKNINYTKNDSGRKRKNLSSPIASKEIVNFLTYETSGQREGFMVKSTKHLKKS